MVAQSGILPEVPNSRTNTDFSCLGTCVQILESVSNFSVRQFGGRVVFNNGIL
jgi:hypothetical protein